MARAPTIPIRVYSGLYNDPGKLYELTYGTRVLVAERVPALDAIEILPYSNRHRRLFVQPGQLCKHYEVRWTNGQVVTRLSPVKLQNLTVGTAILFMLNGAWERGQIEAYVDQILETRTKEKARKKTKYKLRAYLRRPTLWDRLDQ